MHVGIAVEKIGTLATRYLFVHKRLYPSAQGRREVGVEVELVEHVGDRHAYGIVVVELDGEIALAVELSGKCAEHPLEEGVDCGYVEIVIVEQQLAQRAARRLGQFGARAAEFCAQFFGVGSVFLVGSRQRSEGVELVDDAPLHFLRGLVGESDGENRAVARGEAASGLAVARVVEAVGLVVRVLYAHHGLDKFVGKGIGFAGSCRSLVDCEGFCPAHTL